MKSLRYILFAMSLPLAVSVSAQELAGSQVRIDNKAVSLGSDTQLLVGMDVTVPADMKLTTISGVDVPMPTIVSPIMNSLRPNFLAILEEPSTR